ncbi:MAG: universal stress protein [Rubrivivax sp.]
MKVLIPVDGSEAALAAVRHVLALRSAGLRADTVLVNVQETASLYEMVVVHDANAMQQAADQAGAHLLAPALQLMNAAEAPCEALVATGDTVAMLIETCERQRAELIVMGARAVGSVRGALLGSTSQQVTQRSPVPVTIVHATRPNSSS